jgi:hypothetical protein
MGDPDHKSQVYVPGFKTDVFISYCHGDNVSELPDQRGWISDFGERLQVRLPTRLGAPVQVWWDKKLHGDHALDEEIRAQIEGTAVFLAVVTPLYLNSRYCTEEREWFRGAVGEKIRVGTRMRGIRVVKTPKSGGSHRGVFPEQTGFEFFREVKGEEDEVEEFSPASREFDKEFKKVCSRIMGLLETLRRQRVGVYVAQCHKSLAHEREKLIAELTDQGYRVLPEIQIDSQNVEEEAGKGLKAAQLSVHLFGPEEDALSVRQARIAMKTERPLVAWTSEKELHRSETKYGEFLRELMQRSHYLDGALEEMKREVLTLLKPREEAPPRRPDGPRRVYILCSLDEYADVRRASQLKKWIEERDHFEVDLPETGPLAEKDLIQEHETKLLTCDGLLLYWGQADEGWFSTTRVDLGRRRFRSGAIALGDPSRSAAEITDAPVIPLYRDFRYEALEPFLQPLRQ